MNQSSDHHTAKVIGVSVAAAVGGFLFGFDSSVINGAVDSIEDHFSLGSFTTGFVVAIALIGCAVGAWFAGSLADRWGRKKVMLLGSALFTISSIGSGFAFSVPDLMLWRVLGGLGIGIASVIAPAYIAEIAPAKWRGSLASLQQLAITIGLRRITQALGQWAGVVLGQVGVAAQLARPLQLAGLMPDLSQERGHALGRIDLPTLGGGVDCRYKNAR